MKKQFTEKLTGLKKAFFYLFKVDEDDNQRDKAEIIKKALFIGTSTNEKIQIFKSVEEAFKNELIAIEERANEDKKLIYDYNKKKYPELYTKSSIVNDPIFDRPLKDIETDYELINDLDKN